MFAYVCYNLRQNCFENVKPSETCINYVSRILAINDNDFKNVVKHKFCNQALL